MTEPEGPAGDHPDGDGPAASDRTWDLLGSAIRIACSSAATGRTVDELMGAFPTTPVAAAAALRFGVVDGCDRHGRAHCGHRGTSAAAVADTPGAVLEWLLTEVNRAAIDGFSGLAVHAGVVARDGKALAFPAPSGTGKTTLVAAALRAGFDYVSDEALCVDWVGRELVGYPRALALSDWSRGAVDLGTTPAVDLGPGEVAFPPGRLGARVAAAPVRLAHVVRLERRGGPAELVPMGGGDAMALLLTHSFNHYKRPAESFTLAAGLARDCGTWHLAYGDPLEAAALLSDRLG